MTLVDESDYHKLYVADTHLYGVEICASYILVCKSTRKAVIVENGASKGIDYITAGIKEAGITVDDVLYVIVSHIHLDHAGCSGTLMKLTKNATFVVSARGAKHMENPANLIKGATAVYGEPFMKEHYGEILPVPGDKIYSVTPEGNTFVLDPNTEIRVEQTAGHAPHHIFTSLWLTSSEKGKGKTCRGIFSGDQFAAEYPFQRERGRKAHNMVPQCTPPQFDPPQWHKAIDRVAEMAPQLLYLTHYGVIDFETRLVPDVHAKLDKYVAVVETAIALPAADRAKVNADYFYPIILDLIVPTDAKTGKKKEPGFLANDGKILAQGLAALFEQTLKKKEGGGGGGGGGASGAGASKK